MHFLQKNMNKQDIYKLLIERGFAHEITEHSAVFNMAEVAQIALPYPQDDAKNLFVRDDKKETYCLITVKGDKRVDLKSFRMQHGLRSLCFASEAELMDMLGLIAGAVTPLGLLNDDQRKVRWFLDRDFAGGRIGVHPNDNTATVWLQTEDLLELIREHGNPAQLSLIPEKS